MTETTPIQVGQVVPDFKIDTFSPTKGDFETLTLEGLKKAGKWTVLFFYPADFTFVCATEFAALAEKYAEFQKLGAEVITVSTDTKFTHLAWHQSEGELAGVKYPMGADRTGALSKMFGVYDAGSGLALRGTFIISPTGTLAGSEINFYNLGRNVDELFRKVKANAYLSQHKDEVCPAKWKGEGDKTLKPNAKLVGKVHQALKG